MKAISIVIPTAKEPGFLDCALRSVAGQSIVEAIEEVLVSENQGDTRSREVCGRFPELPIRYVLQDPPLTLVENFRFLLHQARAPLLAFLCDDDWWGRGHLERAVSALNRRQDSVASFASSYFISREMPVEGNLSITTVLWVAAGKPSFVEPWILSEKQMLATTWIVTPFHISSMVARREVAVNSFEAVTNEPPYQIDRSWFRELGMAGSVVFEPLPDTFVRWRPDNTTLRTSVKEREAAFRECTRRAWKAASQRDLDLAALWHGYLLGADEDVRYSVGSAFRRAMDIRTLKAHGFNEFVRPNVVVRGWNRGVPVSRRLLRRIGLWRH